MGCCSDLDKHIVSDVSNVSSLASVASNGIRSLRALVFSTGFEIFFAGLILANVIVLAIEAEHSGLQAGATIPNQKAFVPWPGADEWFKVISVVLGAAFTVEVLLKLLLLGCSFLRDVFHLLDALIIVGWVVEMCLLSFGLEVFMEPTLLRSFRLFHLLRLGRLVKTVKQFDSLIVMTAAIKNSGSALMWTLVVLVVLLVLCAMFIQSVVEPFILEKFESNENGQDRISHLLFMYYGTFARAMLTMFEITLGNWMPPCRALVEHVSGWFAVFSIGHKLFVGFAITSVIRAVFIQETFKAVGTDDDIMVNQKERAALVHMHKMDLLFCHTDKDGDGHLSKAEFNQIADQQTIRHWLSSMELDVHDVEAVFDLIDNGDGKLTAEELVLGASHLKGAARNIDIALLLKGFKQQNQRLQQLKVRLQLALIRVI